MDEATNSYFWLLYSDFALANTPEGFCKSLGFHRTTINVGTAGGVSVNVPLAVVNSQPPALA